MDRKWIFLKFFILNLEIKNKPLIKFWTKIIFYFILILRSQYKAYLYIPSKSHLTLGPSARVQNKNIVGCCAWESFILFIIFFFGELMGPMEVLIPFILPRFLWDKIVNYVRCTLSSSTTSLPFLLAFPGKSTLFWTVRLVRTSPYEKLIW